MHTLSSGTLLQHGTYRIEKVLGQGSFGITYLATAKFTTQGNLGKMDVEAKVAIKEFFMSEVNGRSEDGSTVEGSTGSVFSNYRKKFKKEAENLSKLEHPNIVKVFDVFDENNTTYYVMEFLEGQNLDDYIKDSGFIKEEEAIRIVAEIGRALAYMHSHNMLHLDIKPKNIMRKADGKDYLIDFGLSKQFTDDGEPESSTSIGLGTPGYAPIEQAGYKQDGSFPATLDVYALGATMFKMLTGKRPPDATYILNDGFPENEFNSKGISGYTQAVLTRAMAPIKRQRYQSINSFINEFEESFILDLGEDVTTMDMFEPKPKLKPKQRSNLAPEPQAGPKPIRDLLQIKSYKWIWCIVFLAIVLTCYFGWDNYTNKGIQSELSLNYNEEEEVAEVDVVVSDSFEIETTEPNIQEEVTDIDWNSRSGFARVTDMSWDSPLGNSKYTGDVIHNIPHGNGIAKIVDGKYAGDTYEGQFRKGKMEGKIFKYTQKNGNTFYGFSDGFDCHGQYTIKSSGEYFVGKFKNRQPSEGKWYDKNGNVITSIKNDHFTN